MTDLDLTPSTPSPASASKQGSDKKPASDGPSSLALRLLSTLTIFLALGDLVWFLGTLPGYLRWQGQGWMGPAVPLFLLWTFIGLPSLICAMVALRLARAAGRPGRATKLAFFLILSICTLVPLMATFATWYGGTGTFPWLTWGITVAVSILLWVFTVRGGGKEANRASD